jgi:uncharacterized repeat protein (TIGR03803 family)
MKKFLAIVCFSLVVAGFAGSVAAAQMATSSTIYSFNGGSKGDGNEPTMLIQAADGNFYGITAFGGGTSGCENDRLVPEVDGCGTIFRLTPDGIETVLYIFNGGNDGGIPSSLVQGQDGMIYGTTLMGGPTPTSPPTCDIAGTSSPCCLNSSGKQSGCGTIFEFNPSQVNLLQTPAVTPNILYTFTGGADGGSPGTLILGASSAESEIIFGTTLTCGNCGYNSSTSNLLGTVFSFVPAESSTFTPTLISSFPYSSPSDLAFPNSLIQWDLNTLYGTAQMGGDTSCLAATSGELEGQNFGCGGVFRIELSSPTVLDLCDFGEACAAAAPTQVPAVQDPLDSLKGAKPQTIVKQSGARFPTGGQPWSFFAVPITLAMNSNGNIYGTTPPGCTTTSGYPPYLPDPYCVSPNVPLSAYPVVASSIFELVPPSEDSTSTGNMTIPYTFSGNASSTSFSPGTDGGGSLAGLIIGSDGNLYGLSGFGLDDSSISSEVFTVQQSGITQYASLSSNFTPTWMIQGSDGNFYGTTESGGANSDGAVFEVTPPLALNPPVQLCWHTPCSAAQFNSSTQITLGNTATLTWNVPNANSLTAQQCYAFVEGNNSSTAGAWPHIPNSMISGGVVSGTASITPTAPGTYKYALTCGGTVSGIATLNVDAPAVLTTPAPGSTLTSRNVTFAWSAGSGVTAYWLYVGDTGVGSSDLFNSNSITVTSINVTGLPTIGATLNVRLWWAFGNAWQYADYTYIEATLVPAILISPSTLTGSSATFQWTTGIGVSQYDLHLSAVAPGGYDLYASGHVTRTFATVSGIPTNGGTIYARLYSIINGITSFNDYTYTEATLAHLTSPAPGSTLTGTSAKFTWSAVTEVPIYDFHLSAIGPGAADLYSSGGVSGTSVTVTGIPVKGAKIYARLYSWVNGGWEFVDYTYTEATLAQLTSPAPGSTLTGTSAKFTWSAVSGIPIYDFHLSAIGPGAADLYSSGGVSGTSVTVTGIPVKGAKIYARLYSWINGGWEFIDYTYTEAP